MVIQKSVLKRLEGREEVLDPRWEFGSGGRDCPCGDCWPSKTLPNGEAARLLLLMLLLRGVLPSWSVRIKLTAPHQCGAGNPCKDRGKTERESSQRSTSL